MTEKQIPYISPAERELRENYRLEWEKRFPDLECPMAAIPEAHIRTSDSCSPCETKKQI